MAHEGHGKQARSGSQDADAFSLDRFLPYQLSVVAEALSRLFARRYEDAFGIAVPEWRVLAVLGESATQVGTARKDLRPRRSSTARRWTRCASAAPAPGSSPRVSWCAT